MVLAYNVHRSFVFIYYGDIAETGQPWQVSEDLFLVRCGNCKVSLRIEFRSKCLCTEKKRFLSNSLLFLSRKQNSIFYSLPQAGYSTVDSASSFLVPARSVSELSSSSNIKVTGCWAFQVDGSPKCKTPCYFLNSLQQATLGVGFGGLGSISSCATAACHGIPLVYLFPSARQFHTIWKWRNGNTPFGQRQL